MEQITKQDIKAEFKKHKLYLIQEFIKSLPLPISKCKYKYVPIKTLDGGSITVWGTSLQDLSDSFRRFTKLRIFV
jgi:hypothetical protein